MSDLEHRLAYCFGVIFPDLNDEEIRDAANTSVPAWDSIAMVTLINVVEEEFDLQIDIHDAEQLTSFAGFLAYMKARDHG